MTRKDYKLIAEIIEGLCFTRPNKEYIAAMFAGKLNDNNKNFDWDKFMEACVITN